MAGAAALVVVLTGCDSVREASDTVNRASDKVSICAEALRLAGFNPDAADPEKAAEEAQRKAEELRDLAGATPDQALKDALNDMANKVGELREQNINPNEIATWTQEKARTLETLTRACA
ncbi:bacteriophage spanin2 family protein [Actinophytocola sp.]|uniref:bacteriophage spanin2 family protein n=1 Tax=Actinophytocola sp. TaxID=1872138 RepID=UPI002D80A76D|nr:bacteriophage spanin2 family protein [Actinophytocola sp.]HET9138439.1 bacteriophage spanin2 family protein [Actinophytocola sp.]